MDWKNDNTKKKWVFIAIGAGALVLALIAFSGICWCTVKAYGRWVAEIPLGFWELFGGSSAMLVVALLVRPLRKRILPQWEEKSKPTPANRLDVPVEAVPLPQSSAAAVAKEESNWRTLYDQLSQDERQAFKSLMQKYCDDPADGQSPETL